MAFHEKKTILTIFLDIEEEWNCDLETAVNYKPSLSTRKTVAPPRHAAPSNSLISWIFFLQFADFLRVNFFDKQIS